MMGSYDRSGKFHEFLNLNEDVQGLQVQDGKDTHFWFGNCEKAGVTGRLDNKTRREQRA